LSLSASCLSRSILTISAMRAVSFDGLVSFAASAHNLFHRSIRSFVMQGEMPVSGSQTGWTGTEQPALHERRVPSRVFD
jgi:hypothetical protein